MSGTTVGHGGFWLISRYLHRTWLPPTKDQVSIKASLGAPKCGRTRETLSYQTAGFISDVDRVGKGLAGLSPKPSNLLAS